MMNIIITIAAVILTAILTIMSFMWGGSEAHEKAAFETKVEQNISEVMQMRNALISYSALHGEWPADLGVLVPQYLKALPNGWDINGVKEIAEATPEMEELICKRTNERLNIGDVAPACSDISGSFMGCCMGD